MTTKIKPNDQVVKLSKSIKTNTTINTEKYKEDVKKRFIKNAVFDTTVTINTALQIALLQTYNYTKGNFNIVNLISDSIIIIGGNILTDKLSQNNKYLDESIKDIYYPLTSALFFAAYCNLSYNYSYIRSLSIVTPVMLLEYYAIKKLNLL